MILFLQYNTKNELSSVKIVYNNSTYRNYMHSIRNFILEMILLIKF